MVSGPRVLDEHVRDNMRTILSEIREGQFAQNWIKEMETGEKTLRQLREQAKGELVETVGAELRGLMRREQVPAR
jgi:ketol-acid reductoisomerase